MSGKKAMLVTGSAWLVVGGVLGYALASLGGEGGCKPVEDGPYSYGAWSGLVDGPHLRFNNDTREWEMSE